MKEARGVKEMLMEGFHKGEAKGRFLITYYLTQIGNTCCNLFSLESIPKSSMSGLGNELCNFYLAKAEKSPDFLN